MAETPPPVKRGPGRPRNQPAVPAADAAQEEKAVPFNPADERIGTAVDPRWLTVGYSDGGRYRCEEGFIVERTG